MPNPLFEPSDPIFQAMLQKWDGEPPLTTFARRMGYTPEEILSLKRTGELPPKKLTLTEKVLEHMLTPKGESKKDFLIRHNMSSSSYDRLAARNRSNGHYVRPRVDLNTVSEALAPYITEIEKDFPTANKESIIKYAKVKYMEVDPLFINTSVTDRAASIGINRTHYYEIKARLFPEQSQKASALNQSFLTLPRPLRDAEWWSIDENKNGYTHINKSGWIAAANAVANGAPIPGTMREYVMDFDMANLVETLMVAFTKICFRLKVMEDADHFIEPFKQLPTPPEFDLSEWVSNW